jgi:hypothetical protein
MTIRRRVVSLILPEGHKPAGNSGISDENQIQSFILS